nr:phosphatidylglycerol lysyltransferase domain-containing protein [uncultured Tyzzerella sp.]
MCLNFKPISEEDIENISYYFKLRSNKTCDSVFLDVYLWKDFYNVKFAIWQNKALLITMVIDGEDYCALPMCKEEHIKEAFNVLLDYFNNTLNKNLKVYLADEEGINALNLDKNLFNIDEVDDAKDYLYLAENLKTLPGKKLRKKKNHINAFLRENENNFYYKTLCCQASDTILEFLNRWRDNKGENQEEHLDGELEGINDILKNCNALNVTMAGIFVNDKLEAFTIGSYNELEKMAIIHIEKANPNIRGLYPYINQQFIINAFPDAYIVNREDDLGLEGLRKAKLSYEPIGYAKKYRVIQL